MRGRKPTYSKEQVADAVWRMWRDGAAPGVRSVARVVQKNSNMSVMSARRLLKALQSDGAMVNVDGTFWPHDLFTAFLAIVRLRDYHKRPQQSMALIAMRYGDQDAQRVVRVSGSWLTLVLDVVIIAATFLANMAETEQQEDAT